jgi:hypothetical protein
VLQAGSCYEALPDDLLTCFALPAASAVWCGIRVRIRIGCCLWRVSAAWLWRLLLLHWLLLLLRRRRLLWCRR